MLNPMAWVRGRGFPLRRHGTHRGALGIFMRIPGVDTQMPALVTLGVKLEHRNQ